MFDLMGETAIITGGASGIGAVAARLGRLGWPEELAAAVHSLASDDAGDITGQTLSVDGGWSVGSSLQAIGLAMAT